MANSWFRFKEFLVKQDRSGMKVTTDACVFGAWVAEKFVGKTISRALDVGTGTGLLSLMVAQKIPALIDAVEIDQNAFEQATENFRESRFFEKINVIHGDFAAYTPGYTYDLIFCNPPFYDGSLRSPVNEINLARHEGELSLKDLFKVSRSLLFGSGYFALLLPFARMQEALEYGADYGFFAMQQCLVRQSEKHDYFRVMFIFALHRLDKIQTEEIVIKTGDVYTNRFAELLKDCYLNF